ncbi:cytochrome P450 [Bradyrhizobium sp. LM6.11]
MLLGPEANELVLFDQQKLFSSTHGWNKVLGLLFPRGLMLLDFDEHRLHRKALSVAFKSGPMKSYLGDLDRGIAARVAQWKAKPGEMQLYPAMKQLTLDLAAASFLGADIGPEVDEVNRAFVDMVAAAVAPIRRPLPGTQMAAGVRGRKRIVGYFPGSRFRCDAATTAAMICSRSSAAQPTRTARCSRNRTSSTT